MKRPSLNALRSFEAAGRCLSFSAAARELNISQAAVSQQIRKLENYLDCVLFIRQHRTLILTGIGQAYHNVVHQSISRLNSITDQLFPQIDKHVVTISCSPSIATLWLVPHLSSFKKQCPDLEIRVNTLSYQYLQSQPSAADLNIIVHSHTQASSAQVKLMDIEITPICSPTLAASGCLDHADQILEYPLIHVLGYDDDWYRWFSEFNVTHDRILEGMSFDSSLMALEAAIRGEGVMLGRRPFINDYLSNGKLMEVFSRPLYLTTTCYLSIGETGKISQSLEPVINWLKSLAE